MFYNNLIPRKLKSAIVRVKDLNGTKPFDGNRTKLV